MFGTNVISLNSLTRIVHSEWSRVMATDCRLLSIKVCNRRVACLQRQDKETPEGVARFVGGRLEEHDVRKSKLTRQGMGFTAKLLQPDFNSGYSSRYCLHGSARQSSPEAVRIRNQSVDL